jgi:hypothetical protein
MTTSTSLAPGLEPGGDLDDAVRLGLALLDALGLRTGDLAAADLALVVRPLLAALNLRVATPERLAREWHDLAMLDHVEQHHAARVRQRLLEGNGIDTRAHGAAVVRALRGEGRRRREFA